MVYQVVQHQIRGLSECLKNENLERVKRFLGTNFQNEWKVIQFLGNCFGKEEKHCQVKLFTDLKP